MAAAKATAPRRRARGPQPTATRQRHHQHRPWITESPGRLREVQGGAWNGQQQQPDRIRPVGAGHQEWTDDDEDRHEEQ